VSNPVPTYGGKKGFKIFTLQVFQAATSQITTKLFCSNRLLDRSQALEQDQPSLDDGQDNEYLKAFKVANFAYAEDENVAGEIAQEDERLEAELEADKQRGRELWEELLKSRWEDEYVRQEIEMGKGRRSRKQVPDASSLFIDRFLESS
jgi:hypothetical protein